MHVFLKNGGNTDQGQGPTKIYFFCALDRIVNASSFSEAARERRKFIEDNDFTIGNDQIMPNDQWIP